MSVGGDAAAKVNWREIPKVELHLHLEGAAPPALVRQLGVEKGVDLQGLFDESGAYVSNDFTSFLRAYERVSRVFAGPDDYRRLTEAVLTEAASHGVIYAEIFLSPTALGYDAGGWRETLAAIEEGAARAEASCGVVARFIPVAIRHHAASDAVVLVDALKRLGRGRMVGFGLAGDERIGVPGDWAPAFDAAREAGFRLTAHAGEFGGPDSVKSALDDLRVERIGHGVRTAESEALVRRVAAEAVTLEVCPGSNVALGVYRDLSEHPVRKLLDAGCAITVSTDDPPFFHTTMSAEYEALSQVHGFSQCELARLARTAIDAAFCDAATKAALRTRLPG